MPEFPKDPASAPERTASLHEGADSRSAPWLLTPNQAAHIENLEIDDFGVRTQRRGARAFGGIHSATATPGGFDAYNDAVFDEFLLSLWGNLAYKSSGNGGWAQIASGASMLAGQLHMFARARHNGELGIAWCQCEAPTDTTVGVGGRSQLVVYSIETDVATQISLAPRAIASFQNRLFYGEDETIGWSEIGDLASYSDGNTILIDPGVGGEITGILSTRDADPRLLILKERAIFVFSPRWGQGTGAFIPGAGDALDTLNSSVRLLTRGTGCVATRSIVSVPDAEGTDTFFLAPDGVRSMLRAENDTQVGAGFPLTHQIPEWINRINYTAAHRAAATVFDNAYHLAVPLDGALDNSHVLRYDVRTKAWSLHTWEGKDLQSFRLGAADRLWMQNNFTTADSSVTGPDTTNPAFQMYSLYSGTFDPSTDPTSVSRITFREESRAYTWGDPLRRKSFDRFTVQVSTADTACMEIAYRRDKGPWTTMTETTIPGSGGTILLGVDQLPWRSSDEVIRRRTVTLSDMAPPAYTLQVRLGGVTGSTEAGQLSIYMSEVRGEGLTDSFDNDD